MTTCRLCKERPSAFGEHDEIKSATDLLCTQCGERFRERAAIYQKQNEERRMRAALLPRMTWPEFCRWLRWYGLRAKYDHLWCIAAYERYGKNLSLLNHAGDVPEFEYQLTIHQLDILQAHAAKHGIPAERFSEAYLDDEVPDDCPASPERHLTWPQILALPEDDFMPEKD